MPEPRRCHDWMAAKCDDLLYHVVLPRTDSDECKPRAAGWSCFAFMILLCMHKIARCIRCLYNRYRWRNRDDHQRALVSGVNHHLLYGESAEEMAN